MTRAAYGLSLALLLAVLGGLAWWLARPAGPSPDAGALEADGDASATAPAPAELAAPAAHAGGAGPRGLRLPRGEGAILGLVRRDGLPVAAKVAVHVVSVGAGYNPWGRGSSSWYERAFALPPAPEAASAVVQAGEDGRFTIDDVGAGAFHLVAETADGATGSALAVVPAEGARVEAVVVVAGGPETLRGRVVHADGAPFAGRVFVLAGPDRGRSVDLVPQGRPVALDAEGRFTASGLPTAPVVLSATLEGRFVARSTPITLPHAGEYLFTVDAGLLAVSGRVVRAEDGQPVAGAEVLAGGSLGFQGAVFSRATTDADGRFDVRQPGGRDSGLFVRAEGFAPYWAQRTPGAGAEPLVIRLVRGATVTGRVARDGDGAPAAGLTVSAYPVGTGRDMGQAVDPATTDADGRYTLTGVAPGEAMVVAQGAGFVTKGVEQATTQGYNPLVVVLKAGETSTVDLVVTAGARIQGSVLDAAGAPVVGAVVRSMPQGDLPMLRGPYGSGATPVASGRDGRYLVDSAIPGLPHFLQADAPGFTTASAGPVTPSAATPTEQEIRFAAARHVEITVLDDGAGSPVAGAQVQGYWGGGSPFGQGVAFVTAADGRVRVGPVPPGSAQLAVSATGYAAEQMTITDGETTKVVRLKPGLDVAGRVVWPDGSPAAGVRVMGGPSGRYDPRGGTSTAADGAFLLRGLPAGGVMVRADGMKDGQPLQASVSVEAGSKDVVLRMASPVAPGGGTSRLVARVTDPEGQPVPRAMARVRSKNGSWGTNVSEGRAQFDANLPSGSEAVVEVWGARGSDGSLLPLGPATVPLPDGTREIEVRLSAEAAVRGTVRGPDGAPVRGVVVRAQPVVPGQNDGTRWWGDVPQARTDDAGAFRLGGLGASDYDLTFLLPPGFAPAKPVRVRGGESGVDVQLKAGLAATVTVLDPDGRPVTGVLVRATVKRKPGEAGGDPGFDPRFGGGGGATTDTQGLARLAGLDPEAAYVLQVTGKGEDLGPTSLDPWTPRDETVRLRRVWSVAGVVRDRAGRPISNAGVLRKQGSGWVGGAGTDAEGRFRMGGLSEGDVVLKAMLQNGLPFDPNDGTGEVRVAAGTKDVVLTLDAGLEIVVRLENASDLGTPYAMATLVVRRAEKTLNLNAHGEVSAPYKFQGLQPGDEATFWIQNQSPQSSACVYLPGIKPGSEARARVVEGKSIRGRIRAPAGATDLGVSANLDGLGAGGVVDPSGAFEIRGLPEGTRWRVDAYARSADGNAWFNGSATASVGDTVEIEVKPPEASGRSR